VDPKSSHLLDEFVKSGKAAAAAVAKNSAAIGKSMLTTIDISERAARDLVEGNIDQEGAEHVAQRGFDQLKTSAVAEGNLAAAGISDWLAGAFKMVLQLLPVKLG
jgi:hypothetical protein